MGTTLLKRTYKCWNDCQPQGCPSHEAVLEYQSVSDSLYFDDGRGRKNHIYMQTPELEALLSMVKQLGESRCEIESVIQEVFGKSKQNE